MFDFFFFQAEDGIRDVAVTGVQTCALPISLPVESIAIDSTGNAYITGSTVSSDFPTKNPLQASFHGIQDAFVAKFNPATSGAASLLYSTYLGSSNGNAFGLGIAVDSAGNAYVKIGR